MKDTTKDNHFCYWIEYSIFYWYAINNNIISRGSDPLKEVRNKTIAERLKYYGKLFPTATFERLK